jgi:hypothetical protein
LLRHGKHLAHELDARFDGISGCGHDPDCFVKRRDWQGISDRRPRLSLSTRRKDVSTVATDPAEDGASNRNWFYDEE